MVNVCVPVIKRYDLLYRLFMSLQQSTVPYRLWVIDNGRDSIKMRTAVDGIADGTEIHIYTPVERPLSVAESWNRFIKQTSQERVIVNDDVTFAPDSLEKLTACPADLVIAEGLGFSCFLIRDSCVEKIGLFDEEISPGYAYYEDEDYLQRIDGRGTRPPSAVMTNVDCGARHVHSATLKAASIEETNEHHRKFKIAQANYARKWGVTF